jgi:hypothetical protein
MLTINASEASLGIVRNAILSNGPWSCHRGFAVCGFLAVALYSASCSSVSSSVVGGGQGNGTKLIIVLRATPLPPPEIANLLSFNTIVVGVSLTPSIGGSVNVPLNAPLFQVDLSRLQSDTAFLALSSSIPAGSYTNMVVSLSNPKVTYCPQILGLTGCVDGSVVTLSGGPATPIIAGAPFPLVVTTGQSVGLAVNVDIAKALTTNVQTQAITSVNVGAADVLTAMSLPAGSTNLPSSALDFIEDVTGIVSSINTASQSVTLQTATKGAVTAIAGATTTVSPNCTTFNLGSTFTCARQGQVASLDIVLNKDGTFTLLEYDPLAPTAGDWIEGVVGLPPSSSTQFQLVINDLTFNPSNTSIDGNLELGAPVKITLVNPKPFVVDTKGLDVPNTSFTGSTDASIFMPGQTLGVHVVSFTPASGAALASADVDFVYLRFTRVSGSVASSAPPNTFAMQSFPSFFGLSAPVTVQLSNGQPSTNFDGVSGATDLVSGQPVSIRALYFGPPTGPAPTPTPFSAAKLRIP